MTKSRTAYLIGRADRMMRNALEQQLAETGLTLNELTTLSVLASRPGLSNAELARRSFVTPQAMHKVIGSLETDGLVERRASPRGGRVLETTLTGRGREALARADECVVRAEAEVLDRLDPDDRRSIHALLEKLTRPATS